MDLINPVVVYKIALFCIAVKFNSCKFCKKNFYQVDLTKEIMCAKLYAVKYPCGLQLIF